MEREEERAGKGFQVTLHFSEQPQDVAGEWVRILKDTYIKGKLAENRNKGQIGIK